MQTVHRQFGKFMKRSPDESQVSVLLKDFDQADKLLTRIIDSTKAWRDAWSAILTYQSRLVHEFEGLYAPIIGSSDPSSNRKGVPTPPETLARTNKLYEEYEDLRRDLLVEVNAVDDRMIRPAQQAKDLLIPMKKTIKKREDKKLDFEHFQGRVDNSRKKTKRSERDNAVLAKAEMDLARAKEEYNAADEHLRQHLPQLITAVFSILPHLLAAQIEIQNTLLAHYYTVLHNYCEQEQFPSPAPPMEHVIQTWEADFLPVRQEAESLTCIANGKAVRQRMDGGDDCRNGSHHTNGYGTRRPSNHRQISSGGTSPGRSLPPPAPVLETKPRLGGDLRAVSPHASPRIPTPISATTTANVSIPEVSMSTSSLSLSSTSSLTVPDSSSYSSSPLPLPPAVSYSPAGPRTDHFSRERQQTATTATTTTTQNSTSSSFGSNLTKKKPPPPPPPPRPKNPSASQALYVTALYDFSGQGPGDLSFREGDRIRVLKKTNSTDDWWEGELRGVRGSFPANYCDLIKN
ncbi:hypothetical protein VTN77DRAFT_2975 [Rasamsonia byssochlamydoides]|uniref:uncharacterized protein n=1 Tax=Rasamsonia byssochlamydoides TaxID=89139 RepID=UPI0037440708